MREFDDATHVSVSEARREDVDAIRAVALAANAEFREPMGEAVYDGYLQNVLDVMGRIRRGVVLVARIGHQIVGTVTVYPDANDEGMPIRFPPGTAGLRATAVLPDLRGQGIGSSLVNEVVVRADATGARRIALHTAPYMGAAQHLYRRHGFERAAEYDYVANDFFGKARERPLEALAFVRQVHTTKERKP